MHCFGASPQKDLKLVVLIWENICFFPLRWAFVPADYWIAGFFGSASDLQRRDMSLPVYALSRPQREFTKLFLSAGWLPKVVPAASWANLVAWLHLSPTCNQSFLSACLVPQQQWRLQAPFRLSYLARQEFYFHIKTITTTKFCMRFPRRSLLWNAIIFIQWENSQQRLSYHGVWTMVTGQPRKGEEGQSSPWIAKCASHRLPVSEAILTLVFTFVPIIPLILKGLSEKPLPTLPPLLRVNPLLSTVDLELKQRN